MGMYKNLVLTNPLIPWRIRNSLERWTETIGRERFPSLYRLLHHGRVRDILQPVTFGPKHHFFGYYDKSPWNASGNRLLAHEVDFNDRPPTAEDSVAIGVVRLDDGNRFQPLGRTHAWNWQQGAMPQWHPAAPERLFFYNDRREGRFVGVLKNTEGGEERVYERPIYAVAPDGKHALSLNFARLHTHRPGYGYAGVSDPWADVRCPDDDGIHLVDLDSGKSRLVVSLAQLAQHQPCDNMRDVHHWVNHIQISRGGRRFAFFHLWRAGSNGWGVRLYTATLDGSELRCLLDAGMISHYDWMDDHRILVWAREPQVGDRFLLCDDDDGSRRVIGEGVLTEDGHCTFSPDRKWVLNDTYPDRYDMRTLMLFRWEDQKRIDLARLYSPKAKWWGEIRCDLHPRWSRDGKRVCIDSVHEGSRQMYVADVAGVTG